MADYGAYSKQGVPVYQQDRTIARTHGTMRLLGVFDGHGSPTTGHLASDYVARHITTILSTHDTLSTPCVHKLPIAIAALDRAVIAHTSAARQYAGTTLCLAMHCPISRTLHLANVGDSRAILVMTDGAAEQVTIDHSVDVPSERARCEEAGGVFVGKLLNGYISMTRGIGDDDLKGHRNITQFPSKQCPLTKYSNNLYISKPDVRKINLTDKHAGLVIVSDGVTAKLSNGQVARIVHDQIERGNTDMNDVAKKVVKAAGRKGSQDNISAVVTSFNCEIDTTTQLSSSPLSSDDETERVRSVRKQERRPQHCHKKGHHHIKIPGWSKLRHKYSH